MVLLVFKPNFLSNEYPVQTVLAACFIINQSQCRFYVTGTKEYQVEIDSR